MKIIFSGFVPLPDGVYERNIEATKARCLPSWRELKPTKTRLAVIGGGPSLSDHIEVLRRWDGDIWAINGAWKWLKERGVDSTFFSLDPLPLLIPHAVPWINQAILATCCDGNVFDRLKNSTVHIFDVNAPGSRTGSSTATGAPCLAVNMGYREIVFFGCESSFEERSHSYTHEERDDLMKVRCDGGEFLTYPDFYIQAQELAVFMRTFPDVIKEQSGGLLRAMVNDPEHDVIAATQSLHDRLKPDVCACGGAERTCWDCAPEAVTLAKTA